MFDYIDLTLIFREVAEFRLTAEVFIPVRQSHIKARLVYLFAALDHALGFEEKYFWCLFRRHVWRRGR